MLKSLRDLFSALLGRGTGPVGSHSEPIFAITTATLTLQTTFDLTPTGRAWLAFRQIESGQFQDLEREIRDLLVIGARETGTKVETTRDKYGYVWVVLTDPQFEDLVTTMHLASSTLEEQGFGKALLAALFAFKHPERGTVYFVYNFKRGSFYPFVPRAGHTRDNAFELRLKGIMQGEMPIEQSLERWYPLWDIPG
ncbi:MAG: hypothetical protein M5U01_02365 [Ardenticatenaceae bacterium]|nr:hypothetical protein [Ardenticatenaceae bacterium]HBY99351.1 hypothetical protein [Chloroflexota bacterium]